jgi:glyoxylase-like metal-dependent hydrolase (beta-lactamase superfamily II)
VRIVDVRAGFAHCQIVIDEVVTIVDVGNAKAMFAALQGEGVAVRDVRRIVITHGDGDHVQGAMELREQSGAEIVAHEAERGYLEGTDIPPFSVPKRLLIRFGSGRVRPRIDRWLAGGETLDGLEIIPTPGHTPGHISVLAGGSLIAGDAFTTAERFSEVPHLMTADLRTSRASIRALMAYDVARAFSGHGVPAEGAREKLRALAASLPS